MDDDATASARRRPGSMRCHTEPSPSTLLQNHFLNTPSKGPSARTRSPLSRSHARSRSSGAPVMLRAHSVPALHSPMRFSDDTSLPSGSSSPGTPQPSFPPQRSPARRPEAQDSSYFPPRSPRWFGLSNGAPIESIQEDYELDFTSSNNTVSPLPAVPSSLRSASGSLRRRPASPLHSIAAPTSHPDITSSPTLAPARYNETVPALSSLHHYASTSSFSSISSTPSSTRSRSPSISSLDTIEDEPDAESEALEADRLWRLSLSDKGDREDGSDDSYKRRGFGYGRGRNTERKRWSVCGGERRADLDLETIWED